MRRVALKDHADVMHSPVYACLLMELYTTVATAKEFRRSFIFPYSSVCYGGNSNSGVRQRVYARNI